MAKAIDRLIELDQLESARQRQRENSLSLLDAVFEALPDALIVTDAAGRVVLFNKQAEFMFGYHRSQMIGEPVEKLLPERDRARHARERDVYNRFEISRRARNMGIGANLMGVRSDGQEFPTDITLARMVVPDGIHNLALIRFSPLAKRLVDAAATPTECEPDEPDAGR